MCDFRKITDEPKIIQKHVTPISPQWTIAFFLSCYLCLCKSGLQDFTRDLITIRYSLIQLRNVTDDFHSTMTIETRFPFQHHHFNCIPLRRSVTQGLHRVDVTCPTFIRHLITSDTRLTPDRHNAALITTRP